MSAETLRRAAALMRERAEAATPEPWFIYDTASTYCVGAGARSGPALVTQVMSRRGAVNRPHIASWHPAVAVAVANMLDRAADEWEAEPGICASYYGEAIEAARVYLGEQP